MQPESASGGYAVARGVVPQHLIDDVLRLLHLDLLEQGHSAHTLGEWLWGICLLYTSPSPRDISGSRMPSSA